jgi:1,4-alpha-glucan branching enzyme
VAASQQFITPAIPLDAALVPGGATFRLRAPAAAAVYVARQPTPAWQPSEPTRLLTDSVGHWTGFPGVTDGTSFWFWTEGPGGLGFKRDSRALELGDTCPDCDCWVRAAHTYPRHDAGFRAPAFHELIIDQFQLPAYLPRVNNLLRPNTLAMPDEPTPPGMIGMSWHEYSGD